MIDPRWLAPLTAFLVAIAFVPGWSGAATSPRWAVMAVSAFFIPWFALPLVAFIFWRVGVDLGMHWALLIGAFAWGWRTDAETLDRVVLAFGAGIVLSAALAVAQWGWGFAGVPQAGAPAGLFVNKNVLAEAAALALVAAAFTGHYVTAALIAPALVVTSARAAALSVAAAFFVTLPREFRFWAFVAALSAALAALAVFDFDFASMKLRLLLWADAVQHLSWLGNGPYDYATLRYREPNLHNEWLQRIYEFGIVGLVPLFILGAGGLSAHRLAPVLVAFGVIACFSFPFAQPAAAWFAAFVCGAVLGRVPVHGGVLLRPRMANPYDW